VKLRSIRWPDRIGWRDHALGAAFGAAYLLTLLATAGGIGIARDESFYFRAANRLTSEERQRTITRASESNPEPQTIRDEFLTIDLTSFHKEVEERLERLQAAQEIVVSDPEILSGTPVIRGTRVPVYDVAASVSSGIPVDRILAAYPSLKRKQVELAALYVEANPQRGRPRQKTSLPPNAKVISRRTGTISKPQ